MNNVHIYHNNVLNGDMCKSYCLLLHVTRALLRLYTNSLPVEMSLVRLPNSITTTTNPSPGLPSSFITLHSMILKCICVFISRRAVRTARAAAPAGLAWSACSCARRRDPSTTSSRSRLSRSSRYRSVLFTNVIRVNVSSR